MARRSGRRWSRPRPRSSTIRWRARGSAARPCRGTARPARSRSRGGRRRSSRPSSPKSRPAGRRSGGRPRAASSPAPARSTATAAWIRWPGSRARGSRRGPASGARGWTPGRTSSGSRRPPGRARSSSTVAVVNAAQPVAGAAVSHADGLEHLVDVGVGEPEAAERAVGVRRRAAAGCRGCPPTRGARCSGRCVASRLSALPVAEQRARVERRAVVERPQRRVGARRRRRRPPSCPSGGGSPPSLSRRRHFLPHGNVSEKHFRQR